METEAWESQADQDGAGRSQPPKAQRGLEKKSEQGGKSSKLPKGKEQPRDMLYYTQKLAGHSTSHIPDSPQPNREDTGMLDDTVPLDLQQDLMSDPSDSPSEDSIQPSLSDILHAVHKCTASVDDLKEKFGGLKETVSLMRQDLQKIRERTTAVEGRVSEVEDQLPPLNRDVRMATQNAFQALNKTDEIENRLRRNNVRIVGLPEKVEGRDPTTFIEEWLQEVFGKEAFSSIYTVERAHRVPPRPLPPGNPPRSMLARLLNYKDREVILRLAREKGSIKHNGTKVSFYPDFSAEVQRRRSKFMEVKKRLQRLQLSYAMMFPAKLRVAANGQNHFFENAQDATSWLDQNEQAIRHQGPEEGAG